jgi:hypothetical protein
MCLTPLFTPQLAAVYINLVKIDNISPANQRTWPTAMSDLIDLVSEAGTEEQGQVFFKFFLRCMLVFDEEVVERAE